MTTVDWTRPIEAVHVGTGAVHSARTDGQVINDDHFVRFSGNSMWFRGGSTNVFGYFVRNTSAPEREGVQVSEQLPPALVERMVTLVREMASDMFQNVYHGSGYGNLLAEQFIEARAIVAELPEVVEPVVERAVITIRGRGEHDVSLAELGRLIGGGARITSIHGRQLEREGQ